jgi:hypothetical protein
MDVKAYASYVILLLFGHNLNIFIFFYILKYISNIFLL